MNKHFSKELEYRSATLADREGMKKAGINAYRDFSSVLAHEDWNKMLANLEDEEVHSRLFTQAKPFLCSHDGEIIGGVYLMPSGNGTLIFQKDWAYVRMLGVLPEYRGIGIAQNLMRKCMDHAEASGEKTLALHTAEFQHAWRIYERLGFRRLKDIGPIYGHTYWLYTVTF